MPSPHPAVTALPFHYTGIVLELSEALRHVLQANDWKEAPLPGVDPEDAMRQEQGNCAAALTRLTNAFATLDGRAIALRTMLSMAEVTTLDRVAPGIARTLLADGDASAPPTRSES